MGVFGFLVFIAVGIIWVLEYLMGVKEVLESEAKRAQKRIRYLNTLTVACPDCGWEGPQGDWSPITGCERCGSIKKPPT